MLFTPSLFADVLFLLIVGFFVGHVVSAMVGRRFFVFDPLVFFWVGAFLIYVIEPISSYHEYVTIYGESVVHAVLLWLLLGVVFLHLGYRMKTGLRLARKVPELPQMLSAGRMFAASLVLIILGVIGWWLQIMSVGSVAAWAAVPRGGENWAELSPYVGQLSSLLIVGVSLLVLHVELHKRGLLLKVVAWGTLIFLLVFFVYLGSRSRTIGVLLAGLMAWSLPRRRSPGMLLLVPLGLALFIVTSFQAEYRDHFRNLSFNLQEIDWEEVPSRILPKYLTGKSSTKSFSSGTEFSLTAAVVNLVPDRIPYALGGEFLQIFTHGIPRAIWPEKPYPRGELWSEVHLLAGTSEWWVDSAHKPYLAGPAPGYIASWYFNGGVLGLLVGGLVTGIFLRSIRGIYDRSGNNEGFLVIYFVLAPIGFGEAVSHPFNWIYSLPLILIPLVIILRLISRGRRVPRHLPAGAPQV